MSRCLSRSVSKEEYWRDHPERQPVVQSVLTVTDITEVACIAQCRRYWWEARETDSRHAHEALGYIGRLYQRETEFEKIRLTDDALRDARQLKSVRVLNAFEVWLKKEDANVLPKSSIGKAFTDTLNQWQALFGRQTRCQRRASFCDYAEFRITAIMPSPALCPRRCR